MTRGISTLLWESLPGMKKHDCPHEVIPLTSRKHSQKPSTLARKIGAPKETVNALRGLERDDRAMNELLAIARRFLSTDKAGRLDVVNSLDKALSVLQEWDAGRCKKESADIPCLMGRGHEGECVRG